MQTVETEIVRAHTRLDGADARLKKIEIKLDRVTWLVAAASGIMGFIGPFVATLIMNK
tara:strand:- start:191 stop:364 length:174 start_codon:yes stop_codon:yes gene_type:complete